MRKKCLAIAKKAMVWALAASMLVATPLTASAAGLRDVYKVEDGWGNVIEDGSQDTRTGTVTTTNTITSTGTSILDNESKILGIVLSETDLKMEMTGAYDPANQETKVLTADIIWDGQKNEELDAEFRKALKWKSGDNNVVALNNLKGKDPATKGIVDEMTVVAKGGGKTTVTVSLDDNRHNIHISAAANVSVTQFASDLDFADELREDAYAGVSLNLNDYLVMTPDTATDVVTYEIVAGTKNATLKNGVLKLNAKKAGETVSIVALGDRVKSEKYDIEIRKANPAKKVEIFKAGTSTAIKSYPWLVNDDNTKQNFYAKLTAKEADSPCTDKVTWSSKKTDIVSVVGGKNVTADTQVELVAHKVGKATITVQTSSGKKATLSVTVKANMTGFEIDVDTKQLYSGQTLKLSTEQYYGKDAASTSNLNFTETALKWEFVDAEGTLAKDMKKVASVNSKGVLTIKPDLKNVTKIKLSATNAKKIGKAGETGYAAAKALTAKTVEFDVTQMDVTSITVYSNMSQNNTIAAVKSVNGKVSTVIKGKEQTIAVKKSRTYKVVATAMIDNKETTELPDGTPVATVLNWASSSEKLATAKGNNNGSGTVAAVKKGKPTISISGSTKKGSKYVAIKTSFKANVTVPATSLVLSTKNKGIAATDKNQTITIKAALSKGTTSKTKDIKWTATHMHAADGTTTQVAEADIKSGKLKLKKGGYKVGDKITVTATLVEAGVKSSITLTVVKPSDKVQFVKADGKTKEAKLELTTTSDSVTVNAKVKVKGATDFVTAGEDGVAPVTYTVSKKGVVQLIGNTVTPIKAGTVKITATTSDGKKATLTVKVK